MAGPVFLRTGAKGTLCYVLYSPPTCAVRAASVESPWPTRHRRPSVQSSLSGFFAPTVTSKGGPPRGQPGCTARLCGNVAPRPRGCVSIAVGNIVSWGLLTNEYAQGRDSRAALGLVSAAAHHSEWLGFLPPAPTPTKCGGPACGRRAPWTAELRRRARQVTLGGARRGGGGGAAPNPGAGPLPLLVTTLLRPPAPGRKESWGGGVRHGW